MRRGPVVARPIAADPLDNLTSVIPAFLVQSSVVTHTWISSWAWAVDVQE